MGGNGETVGRQARIARQNAASIGGISPRHWLGARAVDPGSFVLARHRRIRFGLASSSASTQKSASNAIDTRWLSTRRVNQSTTATR